MIKVGIFTLQDNDNFGNRLQNYALQQVLRKMNFDVYSFKNYRRTNFKNSRIKNYILKTLVKSKMQIKYMKNYARYCHFKDFNKKIKFFKKEISYSNYLKEFKKFDYIIVGSDQVWNYNMLRLSDIDLLKNVDSSKKLSYAASFGVSSLPNEYKSNVAENIKEFKGISVRENSGKKIICDLINREDVYVNLDPTLLLSYDEWEKLINKPKQLSKEKYILCYFLGDISTDLKNIIEDFAITNGCEIIYLLDKNSKYYNIGPSEFLYLEKNSFITFTDSFHSCVFSIIFKRPFIVCDRKDKLENISSRIDNLLEISNLKDRRYNSNKNIVDYLNYDYKNAYENIEKERIVSIKYLRNMLEGEKYEK